MRLVRILFVVSVPSIIYYCDCVYLRATTNSYNIGFENVNANRTSNKKYDIGFENVHSRVNKTSSNKPTYPVTSKPNKPVVTSPPKRLYPTTMKPSKTKVTKRPQPSRNTTVRPLNPKPTVTPKKVVATTRKQLKPKYTTTTTRKPTRPTLPPSIYVKPNISKVIIPPIQTIPWNVTPPPPGWQPNTVTTTPNWNNTMVLQPTLQPTTLPPNENYKDADFAVFLMHLHDFTRKAEHNHQIKYKRYNGDTFDYYYEIYNYYDNGHLAAKNYRVPVDLLKNCQVNTSKVMCVANTNAICLTNGTMMCITHFSATIPCQDQTTYCAITYVPCDGRYQTCLGKNEPLYVGIPCISRVILVPSSNDFYSQLTLSPIEYCVTSVITPKRLYSPVGSFMSMLVETGKHHFNVLKNSTLNVVNYL